MTDLPLFLPSLGRRCLAALAMAAASLGWVALVARQMDGFQMKTRKMKAPRIMFTMPNTRRTA